VFSEERKRKLPRDLLVKAPKFRVNWRDRRLSQGLENRCADRGSKRDPAGSASLLASSDEDLHAPPVLLSKPPPALLRVRERGDVGKSGYAASDCCVRTVHLTHVKRRNKLQGEDGYNLGIASLKTKPTPHVEFRANPRFPPRIADAKTEVILLSVIALKSNDRFHSRVSWGWRVQKTTWRLRKAMRSRG
jgi:hypothetical protein